MHRIPLAITFALIASLSAAQSHLLGPGVNAGPSPGTGRAPLTARQP